MMSQYLKYVLMLIIGFACFNLSSQQITHVPICASPPGYDISNLTLPHYWQFDKEGGCVNDTDFASKCTFFFSFCHSIADIDQCQNASVCQLSMERPDDIVQLGSYVYDPFESTEDSGFYAVFGAGQTVYNKYQNTTCQVSIQLEFVCDPNTPWISTGVVGIAPQPIVFSGLMENSCTYYVRFPYAGACIAPLTTTTAINPPPAKICVPPATGYDISTLTSAPYWTMNIPSGCSIQPGSKDMCTLYLAFCKPFEDLTDCNGASACIRYPNNQGGSIIVGNYSADPFDSAEVNGFQATFPGGALVTNGITNTTCEMSIQIEFMCNKSAEWLLNGANEPGTAPAPDSFVSISSTSCQINVTVDYPGACFKIKPSPIKPKFGLSAGSIVVIIFFAALFLYLLIGMGYNVIASNQSGLKALPHYNFWAETVSNITGGIVFIWRKVSCQKAEPLVYNSI